MGKTGIVEPIAYSYTLHRHWGGPGIILHSQAEVDKVIDMFGENEVSLTPIWDTRDLRKRQRSYRLSKRTPNRWMRFVQWLDRRNVNADFVERVIAYASSRPNSDEIDWRWFTGSGIEDRAN